MHGWQRGMRGARILVWLSWIAGLAPFVRAAAPPTPDHVVIVIEENHSAQSILGNAAAPYINSLATSCLSFDNFYAISHPSQPNYLQFFSGSNQGVTTDTIPTDVPYTTPNLASSIIGHGYTFGGYSQSMPSVGYTGTSYTDSVAVPPLNEYVRRHNPWVNWQSAAPSGNQLPASANMPYAGYFPSDFSLLPNLSIVVPDVQNDMHDGTIAQADTWLSTNLGPYNTWAQTHNSLLIVTFDEDDHLQNNRIPTIFSGPMVRSNAGASLAKSATWNLHNLLRTVGDMYHATPSGSAANVAPITGIWTSDVEGPHITSTFRNGENGYAAAHDTYLESANPAATRDTAIIGVADGSPNTQALIRFDNLIGPTDKQILPNSPILRATLTITTGTTANDQSDATMSLHRMLTSWADGSTWDSLVNGVSADNVEAAAAADNAITPASLGMSVTFDVTSTLQSWVNGTAPNYGWVVIPSGTDGWRFNTSDAATMSLRPILQVTYVPEPATVGALLIPLMFRRRRRET